MMLLLKETADFSYDAPIASETNPKELVVKGLIQRANAENHNKRIYPKDILFTKKKNYIDTKVTPKKAFGELDHCDEATVEFKRVSHVIDKIWFEGDDVWASVRILPTPNGEILKVIFESGSTVGISSRALGSVQKHGDISIVNDDLHIICWDFVTEPSTHNANMVKEARELTESELKKVLSKEEQIERSIRHHLLNSF